jgi:hypothetical protein
MNTHSHGFLLQQYEGNDFVLVLDIFLTYSQSELGSGIKRLSSPLSICESLALSIIGSTRRMQIRGVSTPRQNCTPHSQFAQEIKILSAEIYPLLLLLINCASSVLYGHFCSIRNQPAFWSCLRDLNAEYPKWMKNLNAEQAKLLHP